ncbi:type II toxin-antitoxin system RelE/ParE family toxin [Candidatus Contendibacter odensensis]|uniref:Toxin n=1 Tax=Candidatus Contendobacter odensis Run_B_J11 TaxID=1400861 RepID=A0A7U7GDN3_9GAMM|nr:type II toxin-antitoxin system RelE/ParE family toxin [Candidatus Contendobacter odensis]MBK8751283.1 type II toxin-antitoxin system RelE/ParE family toxin [Candidatus Competibacteraceae bacterium]CDH46226.1 Plasmid stabilization system [Candidatus Contendobacter odensis Run_B_J11]
MAGFHLTQAAKADLKAIGRYTEKKWGRLLRNTYLTMLDQCFYDLADEFLKGQDWNEICPGYRKHSAGRHLVFYRQIPADAVEIVRILHDRMDVERQISES